MNDLIQQLEQASAGSRELDAHIENLMAGGSAKDLEYILTDIERITGPAHYTTSLDAALTLVPEGWLWIVWGNHGDGLAECFPAGDRGAYYRSHAKTEALALCIAALKAIATVVDADGEWWREMPLPGVTPTHWMPLPPPQEDE